MCVDYVNVYLSTFLLCYLVKAIKLDVTDVQPSLVNLLTFVVVSRPAYYSPGQPVARASSICNTALDIILQ